MSESNLERALWAITWHTGHVVVLDIRGTHVEHRAVVIGDHTFNVDSPDDVSRITRWAEALFTHSTGDLPKPPP